MDVKSFYKLKPEDHENSCSSAELPAASPKEFSHTQHTCTKLQHPKRQLDTNTLWRIFPRQQMAFDFAKTCWQNAVVFAFESAEFGHEGQRKYLVTTFHHFSRQYLAMNPPRHYYEVIPEGTACRLYFDIEYKLAINNGTPAIPVLDTFIQYVCYQLSVDFKINCSRSNVLDLDSSNDTKFSRHLIFHLPNAIFTNNIHAGHWVHYICDQLRRLQKSTSEEGMELSEAWKTIFVPSTLPCPPADRLLMLFVCTERGDTALLCDEGVYTRNRNFRLFLSSKLGKTSCLKIAKENVFKSMRGRCIQRSRKSQLVNIFMDTLICNVSYETAPCILSFESPDKIAIGRRHQFNPTSVSSTIDYVEGYSHSPHPLVDAFIISCANKGGVQGGIRRWSYFQQDKLLVYDIKHNRWCENIQRAHKNNNIMMIADLQRGVYYQKCHDPTCKSINYKSNEYMIPTDVNLGTSENGVERGGVCNDELLGPGDISLEDLQDYSLDDDDDGGGDMGLDDETILTRVAQEMDFNFPDTSGPLASSSGGGGDGETDSSCSNVHSVVNPQGLQHDVCSGAGDKHSLCVQSFQEDLLFDRAYDMYESSVKRSCLS